MQIASESTVTGIAGKVGEMYRARNSEQTDFSAILSSNQPNATKFELRKMNTKNLVLKNLNFQNILQMHKKCAICIITLGF